MRLTAIDPGENVGWALFDDSIFVANGVQGVEDTLSWLANCETDIFVVEDFRLRQGRALQQSGSRFETAQIIGAVRLRARQLGVPVTMQSPQDFHMAAMHTGTTWKGAHCPDAVAAYLHGIFYLERTGVLRAESRIS